MNNNLRKRTFNFALGIISIVELLQKTTATNVISYQIIKSGTSVGANYRAAKRARSDREFVAKINIVLEEVDETLYWLEIIKAKNLIKTDDIDKNLKEANELTAIFVSTLKTMNQRMKNK